MSDFGDFVSVIDDIPSAVPTWPVVLPKYFLTEESIRELRQGASKL